MGRAKKHCVDCGAEIDRRAMRCQSCATKSRWAHGDLGDEEYRRKHSEAMKAAWERGALGNEEWRRKNSEGVRVAWERGAYGEECRNKQSEAMKAAWERGDLGSEEWCRKLSEAKKAAWERGDFDGVFDSEEYRRKQSEAMKAAWERGDFDGVFQSPTSIELQIAAALDIMGIDHQPQYRPDGYSRIYDEFVPPNTLLEINGDYWHGDGFPETQRRDAEKAQWAAENGFELIEIWEHEINERGAWAIIAQAFA